MIKQEKSDEMSRQFENIYREHHDPDFQAKRRKKLKLEQELKNKKEDFGL